MKENIHPPYQTVLFIDSATGTRFLCGSTLQPKEREVFEGKEYPVYKLSISSYSHPFFTGDNKLVDSDGRVKQFEKRYEKKKLEEEARAKGALQAKDKKKTILKK
ncbi:type B 50S ribosomal protein L31 [Rhabdochlamydiaceae symbiont of Dictyostelium giganteum]|uniref:type B 50S ribosomal protein L31 n=1 Tax=Rhabdochlamydiaceae symbiont of Dictyostelium giganteum TaxID=3342349 RepID=UPI00384FA911